MADRMDAEAAEAHQRALDEVLGIKNKYSNSHPLEGKATYAADDLDALLERSQRRFVRRVNRYDIPAGFEDKFADVETMRAALRELSSYAVCWDIRADPSRDRPRRHWYAADIDNLIIIIFRGVPGVEQAWTGRSAPAAFKKFDPPSTKIEIGVLMRNSIKNRRANCEGVEEMSTLARKKAKISEKTPEECDSEFRGCEVYLMIEHAATAGSVLLRKRCAHWISEYDTISTEGLTEGKQKARCDTEWDNARSLFTEQNNTRLLCFGLRNQLYWHLYANDPFKAQRALSHKELRPTNDLTTVRLQMIEKKHLVNGMITEGETWAAFLNELQDTPTDTAATQLAQLRAQLVAAGQVPVV